MKIEDIIPSDVLRRLNPDLFPPGPPPGDNAHHGAHSEAQLHGQIFEECRQRGWIALHGSMAERTCRTLGEPDFVILTDGGRVLFVECKTRNSKLSVEQAALKHQAERLGHTVHVVRSFQEFLQLL